MQEVTPRGCKPGSVLMVSRMVSTSKVQYFPLFTVAHGRGWGCAPGESQDDLAEKCL